MLETRTPETLIPLYLMLALSLLGSVQSVPARAAASQPTSPAASPTSGDQPNPFAEGTAKVTLTPEQMNDLKAYVDQSQATLEQALADAKGRDLAESSRVYLEAVKSVVQASHTAHPRTELLMRVILNQALALTYGVPKADGNGFEHEGVLAQTGYQDLLPVILKTSIELALQYVDQDRKAAKLGSLLDLPYAEVAQKRMILATQWTRSVLEQQLAASFGIESLQQWLNTMMTQNSGDQQHQAKFASEITDVQHALTRAAAIAADLKLRPEIISGEQERLARITMRKIIGRMEKDLGPVVVPSGAAGDSGQPSQAGPLGMSFVGIAPGHFKMGDDSFHEVTLTHGFEMQTTDVTQEQWVQVMGTNPSGFKSRENCPQTFREEKGLSMCPRHPVENVSWNDTQDFIAKVNARREGSTYRLPTEAEWEYAARAGTTTAFSFGESDDAIAQYGWIVGNSGSQTHDVGMLKANPWGLYDMHGNVWQWVQDWYGDYPQGSVSDPKGSSSGSHRVFRGGSWNAGARYARLGSRYSYPPAYRNSGLGFRLVRTR